MQSRGRKPRIYVIDSDEIKDITTINDLSLIKKHFLIKKLRHEKNGKWSYTQYQMISKEEDVYPITIIAGFNGWSGDIDNEIKRIKEYNINTVEHITEEACKRALLKYAKEFIPDVYQSWKDIHDWGNSIPFGYEK